MLTWKLKLIAAALLLAGLAGGVIYVRHLQAKAAERDAAVAELAQARAQFKADVAALKEAHAHEIKIAQEASNGYQADLARLERERDTALHVRVCKSVHPAAVPADSAAAPRPDAAGAGHVGEEASEDIGPQLLDYGIACEANALQLDRLIQWVRAR